MEMWLSVDMIKQKGSKKGYDTDDHHSEYGFIRMITCRDDDDSIKPIGSWVIISHAWHLVSTP